MLVYRIALPEYIEDLSGTGAKLYGGRWNEQGTAVVYFASSRAMAIMELLVHLSGDDLDRDYTLAVFDVPDDKVEQVAIKNLPDNWREYEAEPLLKAVGRQFINDGSKLILKVPSVLVEEESNILMNPNHEDADRVKLISKRVFKFDRRLKE